MDDFTIARVIHVLAIVLWIGGVAFVTTVAMPTIQHNTEDSARLSAFQRFEGGFAPQARIWVLIAGISGFWMVWRGDLWYRFADASFWWMTAMVIIWAIFSVMLFILEPFVIHRHKHDPETAAADFRRMEIMHRVLLAASLITTAGAVGGAHGLW